MTLIEQLAACRVLPVITPTSVELDVQLARTLLGSGMSTVEITLRNEVALDSLRAVKEQVPELIVAAGTVTSATDVESAAAAGADFCVSPGISTELLSSTAALGMRFVPGIATATEVMLGMSHGLEVFKLFPAVTIGGLDLLKSLRGPFPSIQFCPTGGLTEENFQDFLALPNVVCCGGSWMCSSALVEAEDWQEIDRLARGALRVN